MSSPQFGQAALMAGGTKQDRLLLASLGLETQSGSARNGRPSPTRSVCPATSAFLATAGVRIRPATIIGRLTLSLMRAAIGSRLASGVPAGYRQNGADSHIVPDLMLSAFTSIR
jgi:hypothetical protein